MRRVILIAALALLLAALVVPPSWAGSPHFVDDQLTASRTGDVLTVSGKEAGLGDEAQVHVVVETTAACLNPGQNFPQAANKESVQAEGTFPVQNGHADWSLDLVAVFQPHCSPPMSVVFGDVLITDTTSGISTTLLGPF